MNDYGKRPDGTPKGTGFFGEIPRPDGKISTELSADVDIDGKNIAFPLLVPSLSLEEINHLVSGNPPTPQIYDKAIGFAVERMKAGLSPFAGQGEQVPLPKPAEQEFQEGFGGKK